MTSPEAAALVAPAVDTLPINVAILDDEGTILYTNRAWQEFGIENDVDLRPDMVGVNYLAVTGRSESETAQRAATGLAEILDGDRELLEFEYPCHSRNERRWFTMRAAPFTRDGERYVAVAHVDVTERYEYRRRLEKSNERLEEFAYAASHDLQEPLRMVTRYLQLLENRYEDELDADAREFIEFAVDGADRMTAMIEGLLEYSRVDTRGDPPEPIDLDAVVDDVLTDLDVRIEETDAEIDVEPLPTVEGDASQLRQLFQNLVDNAITYSGDEPPRVTIDAERDGDEWRASVADEGIGIEAGDQDRIFEVFERLHSRAEHPGTGIGLALCRRIVERHGGEIDVDSAPGAGTTISVTLPAVDDSDAVDAVDAVDGNDGE